MRFGQRTYAGYSLRNTKEFKIVRVIRRTPQFIHFEVDNGYVGKAKVRCDEHGEYFVIAKENNLYVSAANPYS